MSASARPAPLEVVDIEEWVRPLPGNDPVAVDYFGRCARGVLSIERCPACGHTQHYPRSFCVQCGATPDMVPVTGRGTIYSYSVVHQNGIAPFKDYVPYILALVDLDEGPRMMGNVLDCDPTDVAIGSRVQAFMQRANPDIAIPQWRLSD